MMAVVERDRVIGYAISDSWFFLAHSLAPLVKHTAKSPCYMQVELTLLPRCKSPCSMQVDYTL